MPDAEIRVGRRGAFRDHAHLDTDHAMERIGVRDDDVDAPTRSEPPGRPFEQRHGFVDVLERAHDQDVREAGVGLEVLPEGGVEHRVGHASARDLDVLARTFDDLVVRQPGGHEPTELAGRAAELEHRGPDQHGADRGGLDLLQMEIELLRRIGRVVAPGNGLELFNGRRGCRGPGGHPAILPDRTVSIGHAHDPLRRDCVPVAERSERRAERDGARTMSTAASRPPTAVAATRRAPCQWV